MTEWSEVRVSPSHLELQLEQLGWIVAGGGISIQQYQPQLHSEDTPLSKLPLPSCDAIQASKGTKFQITGAGKGMDGWCARDSPNLLEMYHWGSGAINTGNRQETDDYTVGGKV